MVYIPLFISKKCCILLVELVNFFLHFRYLCSNISDLGPENYINKHLLNCDFSWRKRHLIILYTDRCRGWGSHLYSESCHTVATWQSFSVIFNNLLHLFDFFFKWPIKLQPLDHRRSCQNPYLHSLLLRILAIWFSSLNGSHQNAVNKMSDGYQN